MRFQINNDQLCIFNGETLLFSNVTAYVRFPGDYWDIITRPAEGTWTTDGATAVCDNFRMELKPCDDGFLVRGTFTNTGAPIHKRCDFFCFAGTLPHTVDRICRNRYTVVSSYENHVICDMHSAIDSLHTVRGEIYESADFAAFDTPERDAFVFGAATFQRFFSSVSLEREGYVAARTHMELSPSDTGDSFTSEWFFFSPVPDCVNGLNIYSAKVGELAGVKRMTKNNPVGYCTWYYYGNGIYPDAIRQNLDVYDANREDLPIQYVQIDDGWQDNSGDWNNNEKFPDMGEMAQEIRDRGYTPAIWITPYGAAEKSKVFQEHPDWFVHAADGEGWPPVKGVFDCSHPEARAYLAELARKISYEWGYRYIKMDFGTNYLLVGKHYDPNITGVENYKLILQTIRENITPDTFLLGCTSPFGPAIGLVDGMRVSYDIAERWDSLREIANGILKRYHYHRSCFLIDADCLIIRKAENEDSESIRFCTRNDTEIRTYLTLMAASGGVLMLSDKMPNMHPYQLKLMSKLFPPVQDPALPLDLMDSFIPSILDFGAQGTAHTVAFSNWSDVEQTYTLEHPAALAWEFWDHEFRVHTGGTFRVTVAPHATKVFFFTDPAAGALCGSDACILMQTCWKADENSIRATRLKHDEITYAALRRELISAENCQVKESLRIDGYVLYEVTPEAENYALHF